ncbi:MAG: hypothetical protein P1V20_07960 [Verrucomicrobiales bacterium]|nr:hypothetical protein [Verrucomicrobiales bacterium]
MKIPVVPVLICLFCFANSVVVAQEKVLTKLEDLVVPTLSFANTPLVDALAFVQKKSVELDPENTGVNVVILEPQLRNNPVTLRLTNASLKDVIRYTSMLGGAHMKTTRFAVTISSPVPEDTSAQSNTDAIEAKMKEIVLPGVEFHDTPLIDAIQFLTVQASNLDPTGNGGVNIVYRGDRETDGQVPVTLRLASIPMYETLNYTVQIAGHSMTVEPNAIVISKDD